MTAIRRALAGQPALWRPFPIITQRQLWPDAAVVISGYGQQLDPVSNRLAYLRDPSRGNEAVFRALGHHTATLETINDIPVLSAVGRASGWGGYDVPFSRLGMNAGMSMGIVVHSWPDGSVAADHEGSAFAIRQPYRGGENGNPVMTLQNSGTSSGANFRLVARHRVPGDTAVSLQSSAGTGLAWRAFRSTVNWSTRGATLRAIVPSGSTISNTIPLAASAVEGTPSYRGFRAALFDHRYSTIARTWQGKIAVFVWVPSVLSGGDLTTFESNLGAIANALNA